MLLTPKGPCCSFINKNHGFLSQAGGRAYMRMSQMGSAICPKYPVRGLNRLRRTKPPVSGQSDR